MLNSLTKFHWAAAIIGWAACCALIPATTWGLTLPSEPPPLPSDPEQWINSSPLSYEGLRGKGVVFWYFEETCPSCARRWPETMAQAVKFSDEPVVFIAVVSGCARQSVLQYVAKNRVDWPVLVDVDRSFESQSGEVAISLQATVDVRIVAPNGSYSWGWWDDIPQTVKYAGEGARWKNDAAKVPEPLRLAARHMEFGDYVPAVKAIKAGLDSQSSEVRRMAGFMQQAVQRKYSEAATKITADNERTAWDRYHALWYETRRFAGHEPPAEVVAELKQLAKDPAVLAEQKASKAVEANLALYESSDEAGRQTALSRLAKLSKKYPNSPAMERAKKRLSSQGATLSE